MILHTSSSANKKLKEKLNLFQVKRIFSIKLHIVWKSGLVHSKDVYPPLYLKFIIMKNILLILSTAAMTFFHSCSGKVADLVIINGRVLTIDRDKPSAEAIAIKGETIIAVGSTTKISKLVKNGYTKVIDAGGRLVIPGFNDAHVHFGPLDPDYIELRYTTDPSLITEKVKAKVLISRPGELIRGGHWEHEMFTDKKWPTK